MRNEERREHEEAEQAEEAEAAPEEGRRRGEREALLRSEDSGPRDLRPHYPARGALSLVVVKGQSGVAGQACGRPYGGSLRPPGLGRSILFRRLRRRRNRTRPRLNTT